jgi:hypothetical protein
MSHLHMTSSHPGITQRHLITNGGLPPMTCHPRFEGGCHPRIARPNARCDSGYVTKESGHVTPSPRTGNITAAHPAQ